MVRENSLQTKARTISMKPKVWRFLLLATLATFLTRMSMGQEPAGKRTEAVEQASKEVLELENEQVQYVQTGDAEALERVYAEGIAYTYANGELVSKAEALARIRSGKNKLFVPNHDEIRVHVYGDTVVLTGRTQSTLRCCDENATSRTINSRFTKVYVRLNGRWQMVVHQTTPVVIP